MKRLEQQYEEYDEQRADKARALQTSLQIVDRAIESLITGNGGREHTSSHSKSAKASDLDGPIPAHKDEEMRNILKSHSYGTLMNQTVDQSHIINTSATQLSTCPNCLLEMDSKKLKIHMSQQCRNREIVCPEPTCGCRVPMKALKRHLDKECEVVRKRKLLLEEAARRKHEEEQKRLRELEERLHQQRQEAKARLEALMQQQKLEPNGSNEFASTGTAPPVEAVQSTFTSCPLCAESLRQSQLRDHLSNQCFRRPVVCPNCSVGCKQHSIPLYLLQDHLRSDCIVERHREDMIRKSNERRETVQCPGCGLMVALMDFRRHEVELCANRKVHCRNHALGCCVMVRLKERNLHEVVDGRKYTRNCLHLNGQGAHLVLDEDDVPCPWTAEYWLYRTPARFAGMGYIRNVLLQVPTYNLAYHAEVVVKNRVLSLVTTLKNIAANEKPDPAEKLTKEEKIIRSRELAQRRLDMVNELNGLVALYSDAVLAYTRALQDLAISVEAGLACAKELMGDPVVRRDPKVTLNLKQTYPGRESGATAPSDLTTGKLKASSVSSVNESPMKSPKAKNAPVQAATDSKTNYSKLATKAVTDEGRSEQRQLEFNELLEESRQLHDTNLQVRYNEDLPESVEGEYPLLNDATDSERDEDSVSDHSEEELDHESMEKENLKRQAESDGIRFGKVSKSDLDRLRALTWTHLSCGNAVCGMFSTALLLENRSLYEQIRLHVDPFIDPVHFDTSPKASHLPFQSEIDNGSLKDSGISKLLYQTIVNPKLTVYDERDIMQEELARLEEERQHRQLDDSRPKKASYGVHELVSKYTLSAGANTKTSTQPAAVSTSGFSLAELGLEEMVQLSWTQWIKVFKLFQAALRADLNRLIEWRIEAGLVKVEKKVSKDKKSGTSDPQGNDQSTKASEKKDKERKRREMKKQRTLNSSENGQLNVGDQDTVDDSATAVTVMKDTRPLAERMTSLLKSGCGSDIFAETHPLDGRNVSKLCLSLDSGLSIFQSDDNAEAGNDFERLIKVKDVKELLANTGRIGVVCAKKAPYNEHITDIETQSFGIKIARGVWSHVAIVATSEDRAAVSSTNSVARSVGSKSTKKRDHGAETKEDMNSSVHSETAMQGDVQLKLTDSTSQRRERLTLYLDGYFVKQLKGVSFPLPMASLLGSKWSYNSFEGAVCDVRYWSKRKSELEVKESMHRLLNFDAMDANSATKSMTRRKENNRNGVAQLDSVGLIGWWTFEDGARKHRVTDVTGHRFKTKVVRTREVKLSPFALTHDELTRTVDPADLSDAFGPNNLLLGYMQQRASSASAEDHDKHKHDHDHHDEQEQEQAEPTSSAHNKAYRLLAKMNAVEYTLSLLPAFSWLDGEALEYANGVTPMSLSQSSTTSTTTDNTKTNKQGYTTNAEPNRTRSPEKSHRKPPAKAKPAGNTTSLMAMAKRSLLKDSGGLQQPVAGLGQAAAAELMPIPSYRARGLCPFEIKRFRLATSGRELQREVECPIGCKEKVRYYDLRFHLKHECMCRLVRCRFEQCGATFQSYLRERHETDSNCEAYCRRQAILDKAADSNQMVVCMQCAISVKARNFDFHNTHQCPHRLVPCPNSGCSAGSVPAHLLERHMLFDCDSPIVEQRDLLVERARKRLNYPRPWGLHVTAVDSDAVDT